MSIHGPIPLAFGVAFPNGAVVIGDVSEVLDFEASTREKPVQAKDRDSNLPLWQVSVLDMDPLNTRDRVIKVKIPSAVRPVPPAVDPNAQLPMAPVLLEGLTVTPYVQESGNGRAKLAYSYRAREIREWKPQQNKAA